MLMLLRVGCGGRHRTELSFDNPILSLLKTAKPAKGDTSCRLLASEQMAHAIDFLCSISEFTRSSHYAALRPTVPFFLRSAHLFFIISDIRFLPSALM